MQLFICIVLSFSYIALRICSTDFIDMSIPIER